MGQGYLIKEEKPNRRTCKRFVNHFALLLNMVELETPECVGCVIGLFKAPLFLKQGCLVDVTERFVTVDEFSLVWKPMRRCVSKFLIF